MYSAGIVMTKKHKNNHKKKAFTLIEVILVAIILGALASIALVKYRNIVESHRSERARMNLISIHNMQQIYISRAQEASQTICNAWALGRACINAEFNLDIQDTYFQYTYIPTGGLNWTAVARRVDDVTNGAATELYRWEITQDDISDTNPQCSEIMGSGTCPPRP